MKDVLQGITMVFVVILHPASYLFIEQLFIFKLWQLGQ